MKNVILASKSKRRLKILQGIGLPVKTILSDVDEDIPMGLPPEAIVMGLASRKARAVARDITDDDSFIIGADTIVLYNGIVLGKPNDETEAYRTLTMLSGNWHLVYTGIAVVKGKNYIVDYQVTRVKFRNLTDNEIESYIKTNEPMDKAGSYGIQEIGGLFVECIEGDYYNVVGLPLCKLSKILYENFDTDIFNLMK